jgi:hypothetical protein
MTEAARVTILHRPILSNSVCLKKELAVLNFEKNGSFGFQESCKA